MSTAVERGVLARRRAVDGRGPRGFCRGRRNRGGGSMAMQTPQSPFTDVEIGGLG
jgi:hypothetical protein